MADIPELQRQAQAAFEEMKAAELRMDDMDIVTESSLFRKAMAAAERWHTLCDQIEAAQRPEKGLNG